MKFDTIVNNHLVEEVPTRNARAKAMQNLGKSEEETKMLQPKDTSMIFETDVDLTLFPERGHAQPREDYDGPQTATIRYKLHMEYGRRGLKGIQYELVYIYPLSIERTRYDNDNYENPQTSTVEIDLSNLTCIGDAEITGDSAIAQSMEIRLDSAYKPTYCKIDF